MSGRAIKDLQRQFDELAEELVRAKAQNDVQPNTVYVLPNEPKIKTFTGNDGSSVATFVEDIRAALKLKKLRGQEAADFVISYLAGPARQEIRHHPDQIADKADAILETLLDIFGERRVKAP